MFLFIEPFVSVPDVILEFKYISCSYLSRMILTNYWFCLLFKYISCSYLSYHRSVFVYIVNHLNTSHVLIYLAVKTSYIKLKIYLNTSHVLIYPGFISSKHQTCFNLNTSHVLIYQYNKLIQSFPWWYLNTSHVLIYRRIHLRSVYLHEFKYISCSYLSRYRFLIEIYSVI